MLARAKGLELPAWTEEGLRRTVFKDSYTSLDEYLKGFSLTGAVMDDAPSVERIAYELASLELVRAAVAFRDAGGARIVGFDIAGSERGYPASNHREAYEYAHRNFLHKTVHAGEAYGAESIFTAITKCHADRIGHGLLLFSETDIADPDIVDRTKYVRDLANYIADRRITVEVCLTSNMQTNPRFADIRNHSLALMLEHGLSVTFCTDNRLVSNTSVCAELRLALDNFRISASRFKDIVIYGFKRSFRYGSYADKRTYVRSCIDWYEKVAREHGVEY